MAPPVRSTELSGRRSARIWAVIVAGVVGGVARMASHWLSAYLLGITADQRVFTVELTAIVVPALVLIGTSESLNLDQPAPRRCFLLVCIVVLAVAIPSQLLALAILLPWLDAEAGVVAQIGLMLPAGAIEVGVVLKAAKSATRLCAGPDRAANTSGGHE